MDGEREFKPVFRSRIVVRIGCYFVTDLLDPQVLCGDNCQAAAVDQIVGLGLGVSFLCFQIFHQLFDQGIRKVGIRCVIFGERRCLQDTVVYIVRDSLVVLRLIDVALFKHIVKHGFAPLCIFLRILDRVIPGRILGDRGDDRTLGKGQIRHILIKVAHGSCLHAKAPLSKVDRIHIGFKDLFLVHFFFKLKRKVLLLQFTLYFVKECFFINEIRVYVIFNELLGQRAGTLGKVESIGDPDKSGTDDALQIDPVVFVETLVLDRYKSVGHKFIVRGDLVVCLVHTVGIRVLECFNDCAVCIYNVRCISFWKDIFCRYSGRIVNDLLGEDSGSDYADQAQEKYADHQGFKEAHANALFLHSFFRRNILFPFGKIIFSVIHE